MKENLETNIDLKKLNRVELLELLLEQTKRADELAERLAFFEQIVDSKIEAASRSIAARVIYAMHIADDE